MAEWPKRVTDLFVTKNRTKSGAYSVKICDTGIWKEIILDDKFPCKLKHGKLRPVFTRTENVNSLWVLLLEKAWAKMYGGYGSIEGGFMTECLHDLTGAPTKILGAHNSALWKELLLGEMRNWIMTAATSNALGDDKNVSKGGIHASHAYSVLSAHSINGEKLLRMRNPHGASEWNG